MSNFNNNNVDNNVINVNNLNEQNILELLIKSKSEINFIYNKKIILKNFYYFFNYFCKN